MWGGEGADGREVGTGETLIKKQLVFNSLYTLSHRSEVGNC